MVARMTFELNAPQRPLSAVTTTSSTFFSSRAWRSGCSSSSTRVAMEVSTSRSAAAYGLAAKMRSCARRSFAAATIFMALVICCVFLTLRMRRRRSMVLGIGFQVLRDCVFHTTCRRGVLGPLSWRPCRLRGEHVRVVADVLLLELGHRGAEVALQLLVELRRLLQPIEQVGALVAQPLMQRRLERPHGPDGQVVQE